MVRNGGAPWVKPVVPFPTPILGGNPLSKVETGQSHDSTFLHGQGRGPLLSGERVPYLLYGTDSIWLKEKMETKYKRLLPPEKENIGYE